VAGPVGRVLVGGKDRGAGFALGPALVVTANHVVCDRGDKPVEYLPAGGEAVGVERVQAGVDHDAAVLWLAGEVGEFLTTSTAVRGAEWRVESPPQGGNDPQLTGTVTTDRMTIQNAAGQRVEVVQLEVGEQLGDFGGYSGSAVLDRLGRAALGLLVEQKPLRTPVTLGERRAASNVLYAVPIGDVVTAFDLPVRPTRPHPFRAGLQPQGIVARPGLLDEAAGAVIAARGGDSGAGLVLLRGAGGVGKTVLARQVAEDVRIWAEFTDGIIMLRVGQNATADGVAGRLQELLAHPDEDLKDVLDGQRLLLIVDDVWDQQLLETLQGVLPATVTVLATSRGVAGPGAVKVGAVPRDQAIEILARGTSRTDELDRALGDLAETLFGWALLLTLAAAELHHDNERGWGFGDDDKSHPNETDPGVLIERAETLKAEFPDDPTMLDDLERTPEDAPPRSIDVLVRRSLDWLGPEQQARFELLAIYPPGAAITQPMLEDLWESSANSTWKITNLLLRVGLAQPVRRDPPTIELHDLITAWLHHERGHPGDPRHQPVHQRLAGLSLRPDGSPGTLTTDRAHWLTYHLVTAGAWDRLTALPALRWRSAFLAATGSDAAFLAGLDHYGHAAITQAPDPVYHAVRAWLFAAHVRTLIGQIPIPLLVAMARVRDPIDAITQASQHPDAYDAVPAVLAAITDPSDIRIVLDQAPAIAQTIPTDWQRSVALAAIAEQLAATDPALIDQALAVAGTIPDAERHAEAQAAIAERLAITDPARAAALMNQARTQAGTARGLAAVAERVATIDPAGAATLIDRALTQAKSTWNEWRYGEEVAAVAERLAAIDPARDVTLLDQVLAAARGIYHNGDRSRALAAIAERLAATDPPNPALLDQALTVARDIPDTERRAGTLAAIAGRLAAADPQGPALLDQVLAAAGDIYDDGDRSRALAAIAARLAADPARAAALIDQALAVADAIPDNRKRGEALAAVAGRLAAADPARAATVIDQARAVADTIPSGWERSSVLAAIADQLAAADGLNTALIDRALAAAGTIADGEHRRRALAAVADRLAAIDPARAATVIDQLFAAADIIPSDRARSEVPAAIAGLLAVMDPARAAAVINQVLAAADTIPGDRARSRALAAMAGLLADRPNPTLMDQVLALRRTIPRYRRRGGTPAAIAGRLAVIDPARATAVIDQVLAAADTIPNPADHGKALAAVAELLAAVDPARAIALIGQARAVADTVPNSQHDEVLAAVAERLADADPPNPALIDQARAVADTIPDGEHRSRALAAVAERLAAVDPAGAAALIGQVLAAADAIPNDWERGRALAAVAGRLPAIDPAQGAALIGQVLAAVGTIREDQDRSRALAAVAGRLPTADPVQAVALIDQALAVAETISKISGGDQALAAIAERLAAVDPSDPALTDRALTVARTLFDDGQRYAALAAIAKQLAATDPLNPALIDRALTITRSIAPYSGGLSRGGALAAIAERLATADPSSPALLDQALTLARTILDESQRSETLAWIQALTKTGMLDELSRWRLRSLRDSVDLLTGFLGNSDNETAAESIGVAVLEVAVEATT
jgi:NB-ARC domain-containing protein